MPTLAALVDGIRDVRVVEKDCPDARHKTRRIAPTRDRRVAPERRRQVADGARQRRPHLLGPVAAQGFDGRRERRERRVLVAHAPRAR